MTTQSNHRANRTYTKISIPLRTFLKRCKSACGCTNVPARICISEPRTGQVDIRDQQSTHSRVHSMSCRRKSARGGCDTDVRRTWLVVSSHVFRWVSNNARNAQKGRDQGRGKGRRKRQTRCHREIKVLAIYWCDQDTLVTYVSSRLFYASF